LRSSSHDRQAGHSNFQIVEVRILDQNQWNRGRRRRSMGVTPQQFEQMKSRLGGSGRSPSPAFAQSISSTPSGLATILGVDPSLRGTGYGVLRNSRPTPQVLTHGVVSCPAGWVASRCLVQTALTLREVIQRHKPSICVIEGLFYAQNLRTALVMGEARGACLLVAAEAGLEIYEIAPRKVKQAIVGYGAAQKLAVAKMVQRMLRLAELPASDAADALSLALTHIHEQGRYSLTPLKRL
jgi:crossover junction endodeoxyribonuclease RuvC